MIYAIIGATASSKSSYSVDLALELNAEVINVDAYSIYKELDIVSAKIKPEETKGVKHHFVSHFDINDKVDIAKFQKLVRAKIDDLISQGKDVVLVGGSNLYMQSILFCYEINDKVVYDYDKYENYSDEEIISRLNEVDPSYFKIAQNNRRRMIKAILYFENTSLMYSQKEDKSDKLYYENVKFIYLRWDRQVLYDRINLRVKMMFDEGIEEEFKTLSNKYPLENQAFKAIGFKEFIQFADFSKEQLEEVIAQNTRRFAKRQLTWINNKFLKNKNIDVDIIDMK